MFTSLWNKVFFAGLFTSIGNFIWDLLFGGTTGV